MWGPSEKLEVWGGGREKEKVRDRKIHDSSLLLILLVPAERRVWSWWSLVQRDSGMG